MRELQYALEGAVPSAKVIGRVGRRTSYEVTVEGMLIHSKLKTNKFPDLHEVVKIVKNVAEGNKPEKVTKMKSATCTIM